MTHTIEQYIAECGDNVLHAFSALPRPSKKLEDWKFFTHNEWFEMQWNITTNYELNQDFVQKQLQGIDYDSVLVFHNGQFVSQQSKISDFLKVSNQEYKPIFESKSLTQLDIVHTANAKHGVNIRIANSEQSKHIVLLSVMSGSHTLSTVSHTIHVEANTQCTITEIIVSEAHASESLMLSGTQLICNAGSLCEYTSIQKLHKTSSIVQNIAVMQLQQTTATVHAYPLSGAYNRTNMAAYKQGAQAHTNVYGILFPCNDEHVELYTNIYHNVPECETNEQIKGLGKDNGQGVFSGLIYVAQDAQKTRAAQSNKNILLSPTAKIHSKPQLEIYADDVSCNHGSTTGQINREALWYMQARGINLHKATELLLEGFINDVLETMSNEQVQAYILSHIDTKIAEI